MQRYRSIAVLGAYGGVGGALCDALVAHTDAQVVVVGRDPEKVAGAQARLGERARSVVLDLRDPDALREHLAGVPLWVHTTSATEHSVGAAGAAIALGSDYMDVGVHRRLASLGERARAAGVTLVDQAGFHPGLCAPLAHAIAGQFDWLARCDIYLAMEPSFQSPQATYEVLESVVEGGRVMRDHRWRNASYRDARAFTFGSGFGARSCYPLDMPELIDAFDALGVASGGVYAAGFGGRIDSTLFPLAWMAYHIRRGLFRGPLSRAFYRASRRLAGERRGVEMVVDGEGTGVGGEPRRRRLTLTHDDAFALTALPMVATILELDRAPIAPGLVAMGNVGSAATRAALVGWVGARGARVELTEAPVT